MADADRHRRQARATWAAGDWDRFAALIQPGGRAVLDRIGIGPGLRLLDVGTEAGVSGVSLASAPTAYCETLLATWLAT